MIDLPRIPVEWKGRGKGRLGAVGPAGLTMLIQTLRGALTNSSAALSRPSFFVLQRCHPERSRRVFQQKIRSFRKRIFIVVIPLRRGGRLGGVVGPAGQLVCQE